MEQALREEIGRRLCLNLLIQGAASHAWMTAHFVAEDRLEKIRPGLTAWYDRLTVSLQLAQWIGDLVLFTGTSSRFWRRLAKSEHPFRHSRFLVAQGLALSRASRKRVVERARAKRIVRVPGLHMLQLYGMSLKTWRMEKPLRSALEPLAVSVVSQIWGIPEERLFGRLVFETRIPDIPRAQTRFGRIISESAAGWSGVQYRSGQAVVDARAWFWPILVHELVKGSVEMTCLHGMAQLDDAMYARVMEVTDQIEHELWMLQSGGELFRLLLAAKPLELPIAHCMMHVSLLEAEMLEQFLFDLVDDPAAARRMMQTWT